MPLMITTRRSARTIEPNIKSSDPDFLIFANAKHEIKFHCTITSGQLFVQTLPHNTERRAVLASVALDQRSSKVQGKTPSSRDT
jgi:hypothetical protein